MSCRQAEVTSRNCQPLPASRPSRWRSTDEGSAVVEFVTIGVLMMVPLVYLVLCLGRVQAAAYATYLGPGEPEGASRRRSEQDRHEDRRDHDEELAGGHAGQRRGLLQQG